ncbi:hypothetical protein ABTN44_09535 [Acinetobacter baumannii]
MNATQFIQEFDIEKARALLAQLHNLGCPDDMKITVINGMWHRTSRGFTYPELKRLVDSVDLVNSLGGLKAARSEAHKDCFVYNQPLLAAIAAYESIYGGGHV